MDQLPVSNHHYPRKPFIVQGEDGGVWLDTRYWDDTLEGAEQIVGERTQAQGGNWRVARNRPGPTGESQVRRFVDALLEGDLIPFPGSDDLPRGYEPRRSPGVAERDLTKALAAIQAEMTWPRPPRLVHDFGDFILVASPAPMETTYSAEVDKRGNYRRRSLRKDDPGS